MSNATIKRTRDAIEYMAGALRTVVAMAKEHKDDGEIRAVAQAGLDLAERGESGCAIMRGDAPSDAKEPSA